MRLARGRRRVAVRGKTVYTMTGGPIATACDYRDGKIAAVGRAALPIPEGFRVLEAAVVTPDRRPQHRGTQRHLQPPHDQDRPTFVDQPELRASAPQRPQLVSWVRGFGVTTIHTGRARAGDFGQTTIVRPQGARSTTP